MIEIELRDLSPDHLRIREVLIHVAKRRGIISATELLKKAEVKLDMSIPCDRGKLGHLLGKISQIEVKAGRPMLSSLVIIASIQMPGQGFFDIAESLYSRKFRSADEKITFAYHEMKKTHNFWSSKKNNNF